MKKTLLTLLLCVVLATAGQAFGAVHTTLLQPGAHDLVATRLVPASVAPRPAYNTNHDPVSFSWTLKADQKIELGVRPVTRVSREYWQRVTAGQLAKGISVPVVTPGAVLRINPMGKAAAAKAQDINLSQLEIITGSQRHLDMNAATETIAREADLDQAGFAFPKGTMAFRLKPELGTGTFTIRAQGLKEAAATPYLVSVVEPHSPVVLAVTAHGQAILPGSAFTASVQLENGTQPIQVTRVSAAVISPDGHITPVQVRKTANGTLVASYQPQRLDPNAVGMWEMKISTEGTLKGQTVLRDIRTAFAYSLPTARLTGDVAIDTVPGGGIVAHLGIESSAEGRYEVRGILYGTAANGTLQPMGIADTAAWLPDGVNSLALTFGPRIIKRAGFHAPYEVRGLRLMDQSRMSVLRQQARGFVIPGLGHSQPAPKSPRLR
ncbi:MAG: DUF4785 family protein [Acidobacteria bacterium]|nr:DUF4785 family protein [Acidobacteriota bacterium]